MRDPEIRVESSAADELNEFLDDQLYAFNATATGFADAMPLHARVTDASGHVIAALSGHTWGGCADVALLWVRDDQRGKGIGAALMRAAEAEAARRGCALVTLSTHSFQAPLFYEKLGYQQVGEIADYPKGHAKRYYVKRLTA
jgi:GNAT superfamily N-acetyltransferase